MSDITNRRAETENSVSDELYVSYKLGLEKGKEINRQKTAEWTEEVPTKSGWYWAVFDATLVKTMVVYLEERDWCKEGKWWIALPSKDGFMKLEECIEKYKLSAWLPIPTPPLPRREGT